MVDYIACDTENTSEKGTSDYYSNDIDSNYDRNHPLRSGIFLGVDIPSIFYYIPMLLHWESELINETGRDSGRVCLPTNNSENLVYYM